MLGLSFEVRQLPGYFGLRNRLGFGWMVSSCAISTESHGKLHVASKRHGQVAICR